MNTVVLRVVLGAVVLAILGLVASVMSAYIGIQTLRRGEYKASGVHYTGKDAQRVGWFYLARCILALGLTLLALTLGKWE